MNFKKYGITVEKQIHKGFLDDEMLKKSKDNRLKEYYKVARMNKPMGLFGKWQYIYRSKNGNMSLIQLLDYYRIGEHQWEIYCLDDMADWKDGTGNDTKIPTTPAKKELTDVERYSKRSEAIKRIVEILKMKHLKVKDTQLNKEIDI